MDVLKGDSLSVKEDSQHVRVLGPFPCFSRAVSKQCVWPGRRPNKTPRMRLMRLTRSEEGRTRHVPVILRFIEQLRLVMDAIALWWALIHPGVERLLFA